MIDTTPQRLYLMQLSTTALTLATSQTLAMSNGCYLVVYVDCLMINVRANQRVRTSALYLVLAVNLEGHKERLRMWLAQTQGAKFWLSVLSELQSRGVKDLFIACVDGLTGLPEAIESVYPQTRVQLCMVHLVRNSLKYVTNKHMKAVATDLKAIYSAATEAEAEFNLEVFVEKWDALYPSKSRVLALSLYWWRKSRRSARAVQAAGDGQAPEMAAPGAARWRPWLRYDVRGFGKSELPPVPYADRQDLYDLLQWVGVEKTYLLGLSLGGVIAIDFTLEHPAMVEALILVGSPVPGFPIELLYTPEQLERQRSRWAAFEKARQERNLPAMVDALMGDLTLVPSSNYPAARERVRHNLSEYSFAWVLDPAPRQELDPPAYERLSEIQVPTLIVMGAEDDRRLFKDADKLQRDILGAKRVTISATHHMPNMEKPEEFNALVLDFLDRL